ALRVRWLLEELELPYQLERVTFVIPSGGFFVQPTPSGKVPVIEDDRVTIAESGAILEYIVDRYGGGRLAPPIDSAARGPYLQWLHFAEGTLSVPLSTILWHKLYKGDADQVPQVIADARDRARTTLMTLERGLEHSNYLPGPDFSAADIQLHFNVAASLFLGVLDASFPRLQAYLERLQQRAAFQRASAD
ncbi:MAG TPA: glutathione S-transferase family protein, partial [Terriglobales bacterium]|nr:glutathione S-transferase family protein [Terriglobales bacterium]